MLRAVRSLTEAVAGNSMTFLGSVSAYTVVSGLSSKARFAGGALSIALDVVEVHLQRPPAGQEFRLIDSEDGLALSRP